MNILVPKRQQAIESTWKCANCWQFEEEKKNWEIFQWFSGIFHPSIDWRHFIFMDQILFMLNDRRLSSRCCYCCFIFNLYSRKNIKRRVIRLLFQKSRFIYKHWIVNVMISCVRGKMSFRHSLHMQKINLYFFSYSTHRNENVHSFFNKFIHLFHWFIKIAPTTPNVDKKQKSVTSMINSIK